MVQVQAFPPVSPYSETNYKSGNKKRPIDEIWGQLEIKEPTKYTIALRGPFFALTLLARLGLPIRYWYSSLHLTSRLVQIYSTLHRPPPCPNHELLAAGNFPRALYISSYDFYSARPRIKQQDSPICLVSRYPCPCQPFDIPPLPLVPWVGCQVATRDASTTTANRRFAQDRRGSSNV